VAWGSKRYLQNKTGWTGAHWTAPRAALYPPKHTGNDRDKNENKTDFDDSLQVLHAALGATTVFTLFTPVTDEKHELLEWLLVWLVLSELSVLSEHLGHSFVSAFGGEAEFDNHLQVLQVVFLDVLRDVEDLDRAHHGAEREDSGAVVDRAVAVERSLSVHQNYCHLSNRVS
jgi:hypothetical protein